MSAIGDYLRETRAELRHVAWPTQTQTIVYTILVAAISLGVAAYLGLFDYIFTGALTHLVGNVPTQTNTGIQVQQQPATQTQAPTTQSGSSPSFNLPGATQTQTQTK